MERRYCVIGDPIEHSLSPAIYNRLFEYYSIPHAVYFKERVDRDGLEAFVGSLRERGILGFNITMPLKTAILPYLAYEDPTAAFGANTVVVGTDGLSGYSTDAQGFERSLELHGRSFRDASVVFIGSGGAANVLIRAAAASAARIVVLNRTPARAAVFEELPHVSTGPLSQLPEQVEGCSLLINATPLGMAGMAEDFTDLTFLSRLPQDAFVCDLIYNPSKTRFLLEAERTGHETMNGLWMLIWQAFYAFKKYTGILPDMNAFAAVRDGLRP